MQKIKNMLFDGKNEKHYFNIGGHIWITKEI